MTSTIKTTLKKKIEETTEGGKMSRAHGLAEST
jgi:hypothetical protein